MPPVKVDPAKVKTFENVIAFYRWLSVHHHKEDEVWIRIYKVGSGLKSITPKEAIDECLCWGWIEAVRKRFDDKSYLQRYTRRRKGSIWSQINVDNVTRLIAEGRMRAWAQGGGGSEGRRALESRLRKRQEHADPRRSPGCHRRGAEGQEDAGDAQRAEPIRAGLSRAQHEDGSRAKEEDRGVRRTAQAR